MWDWLGVGRKGREESLLLDSGDSVGLLKGPRMKAGRETEQSRGGARETKMTVVQEGGPWPGQEWEPAAGGRKY